MPKLKKNDMKNFFKPKFKKNNYVVQIVLNIKNYKLIIEAFMKQ